MTTTRAEKVDEYVFRDVLNLVLTNVVQATDELFEHVAGEDATMKAENVASDLSSDLFSELWPTDEATDGEEPLASSRVCALTSSVFARLTSQEVRDYLLKESARLGAHVAGDLAKVQANGG